LEKIGQMYRSGSWTVRSGKIEEFIKAWQISVDWLVRQHPDGWRGEASLLQDIGSPHEFISFSWSTMPEKTEEILAGTEFQTLMASMRVLCDEIRPRRLQVVSYFDS
jgi:hypothetical protein